MTSKNLKPNYTKIWNKNNQIQKMWRIKYWQQIYANKGRKSVKTLNISRVNIRWLLTTIIRWIGWLNYLVGLCSFGTLEKIKKKTPIQINYNILVLRVKSKDLQIQIIIKTIKTKILKQMLGLMKQIYLTSFKFLMLSLKSTI